MPAIRMELPPPPEPVPPPRFAAPSIVVPARELAVTIGTFDALSVSGDLAPPPRQAAAGFLGFDAPAVISETTGVRRPRTGSESAGFEAVTAASADRSLRTEHAESSAFAPVVAAASRRRPETLREPPLSVPLEILEKPRPVYTEQARQRKLEGVVSLEVLFTASGEVRVLRVLQKLGHGLDENAADAARRIRFRPAQRGGVPADAVATVQIRFQLAY
jgi:TonB family protein